MKVIAVNGSARKGGNTARLLEEACMPLREAGVECEIIELAGKEVRGCSACLRCREERDGRCHGRNDYGNQVIEAINSADGLILGSPTYFADVTAEMKALIDRLGYATRGSGSTLARKPAAAVVAMRRAGGIHAFETLNNFFLINGMIVVGSSYWSLGVGGGKGEVEMDTEGLATMRHLGENMAWVLGKLQG